jgi:hypothetical protein
MYATASCSKSIVSLSPLGPERLRLRRRGDLRKRQIQGNYRANSGRGQIHEEETIKREEGGEKRSKYRGAAAAVWFSCGESKNSGRYEGQIDRGTW